MNAACSAHEKKNSALLHRDEAMLERERALLGRFSNGLKR
jgi:hypothetical protein